MIRKLCLLLTITIFSVGLRAQTPIDSVSGTSTWSKAQSPFLVQDTIKINPGTTLTIEPGTTINFASATGIIVNGGTLIINGTASDSIIFYRDSLSTDSAEQPMLYLYDTITLSYCSFRNSFTGAIAFDSTTAGTTTIQNCSFNSNSHVINIVSKPVMNIQFNNCSFTNNKTVLPSLNATVNNCTFSGNTTGISKANKVYASTFINNAVGIAYADTIMNCIFTGNTTAIGDSGTSSARLAGLRNSVQNNLPTVSSVTTDANHPQVFIGNSLTGNNTGIYLYIPYFNVKNNIITGNEIGISIATAIAGGDTSFIENNTICNNSKYNLALKSLSNFSLPNNCWCSTDSAYIRSTIYDGFVNPSYGQIDYMPLTNCPSTSIDTIYGSTTYYIINQSYKFYVDTTGVSNATYKWIIDGDTVSTRGSATVNWDDAGLHTVTCIAYDGGIPISSYTLPIDAYTNPLAIVPGTSLTPLNVYPNPNNGKFAILNPLTTNTQLSIYNSLGILVQTTSLSPHTSTINLTNAVPGIYYLFIESDLGNFSQKIIVE